jgi:phage terminase small subunit
MLTDHQQRFAAEYAANGGKGTAAAKAAGYSERSAHEIARQLLQKDEVQHAIYRQLMKLKHRSGAVGLDALLRIATDEKASASARVSAARTLCEHAGLLGSAKDLAAAQDEAEQPPGADPRTALREVLQVIQGGQAGGSA